MVFPKSNLSTSAQPWGRFVEKSITNLEALVATEKVNNAARDAQSALGIKRLDASLSQVAQLGVQTAQNVSDILTITNNVFTAGTTEINGYNIKAGTINASAINVGILTGFTVQTATSGARVVMDSSGLRAYNSGGGTVLDFSTSTGGLSLSGYLTVGNAANDINNNSTTINGSKITTGTLSADKIYAGTISASSINLSSSSYQLTVGSSGQYAYLNVQPGSTNGVSVNAMGFQSTATAGWWSNFYPYFTNTSYCGLAAYAWEGIRSHTAVVVTSDERTKNTITESALGLSFINNLRPVSYKYNVGKNELIRDENGEITGAEPKPGNRVHYGLIAQEVKQALDTANAGDFGGWILDDLENPDSPQALRYEEFISPLIKAIQELTARVEQLEGK